MEIFKLSKWYEEYFRFIAIEYMYEAPSLIIRSNVKISPIYSPFDYPFDIRIVKTKKEAIIKRETNKNFLFNKLYPFIYRACFWPPFFEINKKCSLITYKFGDVLPNILMLSVFFIANLSIFKLNSREIYQLFSKWLRE